MKYFIYWMKRAGNCTFQKVLLEENYGIKMSNLVYFIIKRKRYEVPVVAMGKNTVLKTIYLSKTQTAEMI